MNEVIQNLVKELRETTAKLEDAEETAEQWKKKYKEFKRKCWTIRKQLMYNDCKEEKQDGKTRELCKDCSAKLTTKFELERRVDDLRQSVQHWKELYNQCRAGQSLAELSRTAAELSRAEQNRAEMS